MSPIQLATLPPLLLVGLMAGFFYAFSVCVMPGLDRITPSAAIEAMQGINEAVRNPVFFVTFFLTPVAAAVSAFILWRMGDTRSAIWSGAGGLTYLLGALILTVNINVPMNNALALIEPSVANAEAVWREYTERWTLWNTVRTLVSSASLVMMAIGMGLAAPLR